MAVPQAKCVAADGEAAGGRVRPADGAWARAARATHRRRRERGERRQGGGERRRGGVCPIASVSAANKLSKAKKTRKEEEREKK